MRVYLAILFCGVLSTLLAGCERSQSAAPDAQSTSQPVAPATTTVAVTQSIPSLIWIDEQLYGFPPARLVLRAGDEQVVALLFSEDSPDTSEDSEKGNSFYLEMKLDIPQRGTLTGATWDFTASNREWVDSICGIFLDNRKKILQPYQVHAELAGSSSPMKVLLGGDFLLFDADDPQPIGRAVQVRAELQVQVQTASPQR